jgi:predicted ester cyclase
MATDDNVAALHAAVADWNASNLEGYLTLYDPRGAFQGIAATGTQINVPGITILEFRDGRCFRRWSYTDSVGLLQQLGAFPSR